MKDGDTNKPDNKEADGSPEIYGSISFSQLKELELSPSSALGIEFDSLSNQFTSATVDLEPKEADLFGNVIHKTIERGAMADLSAKEWQDLCARVAKAENATKNVTTLANTVISSLGPALDRQGKVVATEKPFQFICGHWLVTGEIDLLAEAVNETAKIIDLKTGVETHTDPFQLELYALAAHRDSEVRKQVAYPVTQSEFWFVDQTGAVEIRTIEYESESLEADISKCENRLNELLSELDELDTQFRSFSNTDL